MSSENKEKLAKSEVFTSIQDKIYLYFRSRYFYKSSPSFRVLKMPLYFNVYQVLLFSVHPIITFSSLYLNNFQLFSVNAEAVVQWCSVKKVFSACNFIEKETLAEVFSCEFCKISKNTFFHRTPLMEHKVKIGTLTGVNIATKIN